MPGRQRFVALDLGVRVDALLLRGVRMLGIQHDLLLALAVDLDDVDAVVVRPPVLDLALARGEMQRALRPLDMTALEGHRMNAVDRDVRMHVVRVRVDCDDVLVFLETQGLDRMHGRVEDRGVRRLLVLRPAQNEVVDGVENARILARDGVHLRAGRLDAIHAVRANADALLTLDFRVGGGRRVVEQVTELVRLRRPAGVFRQRRGHRAVLLGTFRSRDTLASLLLLALQVVDQVVEALRGIWPGLALFWNDRNHRPFTPRWQRRRRRRPRSRRRPSSTRWRHARSER